MKKQLVALVDCSAFYCSCERAFRPELVGKPVVVFSNNDGCVISLTTEAKDVGVKMGQPFHEAKECIEKNKVAVFSSNYSLYGDMSRRVVNMLQRFSPDVEQYSIDEAFLHVDADEENVGAERARLTAIAEDIYWAVLKGVGIPVRVSIAETKTLAKVGSEYTKKMITHGNVPAVCFWEHPEKESFMCELPVAKVWGIGWRWAPKLAAQGIHTAYDLSMVRPDTVRKAYSVVMERSVRELRGQGCVPFELAPTVRKNLLRSRMFGKKLNNPLYIFQAVANHLARGSEKLRHEHLRASEVSVFIMTARYGEPPGRRGRASVQLIEPSNDTMVLMHIARKLFNDCYVQNDPQGKPYRYSKAGVMFSGLVSDAPAHLSLFPVVATERPEIMKTVDALNSRYGKYAVVTGAMGVPDKLKRMEKGNTKNAAEWAMKREHMSPKIHHQMGRAVEGEVIFFSTEKYV